MTDVCTGVACYYVSDEIAQRATQRTHAIERQGGNGNDLVDGARCELPSTSGARVKGRKKFAIDVKRRWRYCAFGAFDGASSYAWYEFVDRTIPNDVDRGEFATTLMKVFFDAACYNPLWAMAFIGVMAVLSGRGVAGAREDLRRDWADLYLNNVMVWAPLNLGIYGAVPLDYRVLAMYVCNTCYVTCLSMWQEREEASSLDSGDTFSFPDVVARVLPDDARADWRLVTGCPRCNDERIIDCESCADGTSSPVMLIDIEGRTRTVVSCAECTGTRRVSCPECTKVTTPVPVEEVEMTNAR